VLDRVDARAQRRVDPPGAVGVRGHLAPEQVPGLHDRIEFVPEELLLGAGRRVAEHAAGRRQLDHVGAPLHLRAHGLAAGPDPVADPLQRPRQVEQARAVAERRVAVAPGRRDTLAGGEDTRPDDDPVADRAAQREDRVAARPQVAHRREPREQRAPRILDAEERAVRVTPLEPLQTDSRAVLRCNVRMRVDQARQHERVAQVDDLDFGLGLVLVGDLGRLHVARADLADAPVGDDHGRLRDRSPARLRQQGARVDHRPTGAHLALRVRGGGDREKRDQQQADSRCERHGSQIFFSRSAQ